MPVYRLVIVRLSVTFLACQQVHSRAFACPSDATVIAKALQTILLRAEAA
jgi:hypothetical protein